MNEYSATVCIVTGILCFLAGSSITLISCISTVRKMEASSIESYKEGLREGRELKTKRDEFMNEMDKLFKQGREI